ncbi:MAG: efflux transporter outer membrane subunit [Sphingomonadales bacterium]
MVKEQKAGKARVQITLGLVTALGLAGCSSTVTPPTDELIREALPEQTFLPSSFGAGAGTPQGPVDDNWIKSFNDPGLEAVVNEAFENNLTLRVALANIDIAAGFATQAGAAMKPAITVSGQGLKNNKFSASAPELTSSGIGIAASWEIDLWGRVRAAAEEGNFYYEATYYEVSYFRQSLAAQTAKIWFLAAGLKLQREYLESVVTLLEDLVGLVEIKRTQGQVTNREVSLVRADLASAQDLLSQVEVAYTRAVRGLEVLLGRYPAAALETASGLVAMPPPIPVGLPSELLERRPDVISAERRVAAAIQGEAAAKAARLPRISLTAGTGTSSMTLGSFINSAGGYWTIGANFLAPIYQGGALRAQVDIAGGQLDAALGSYGLTALNAFSEIENSLTNEASLEEREGFLRSAVADNKEAYRISEAEFNIGRIDLLSLLQMQNRVIIAQVALLNVQSARLSQRVDLHLALGGSFEPMGSVAQDPSSLTN